MADKDTCGARLPQLEGYLTCELPADHTNPTGAQPQGSPHQSSEREDSPGEPWRWWG